MNHGQLILDLMTGALASKMVKEPNWRLPTEQGQERAATDILLAHAKRTLPSGEALTQPTKSAGTNTITDLELRSDGRLEAVWEIKARLPYMHRGRQGGINRVLFDFIKQWKPYCLNPSVERHIALLMTGSVDVLGAWLSALEQQVRAILPCSFRREPVSTVRMIGQQCGIVDYSLLGFPLFCIDCAKEESRMIRYCPTCGHPHQAAVAGFEAELRIGPR